MKGKNIEGQDQLTKWKISTSEVSLWIKYMLYMLDQMTKINFATSNKIPAVADLFQTELHNILKRSW